MRKPDAGNHNPEPAYLRGLLAQAGLTRAQAAERIGVTTRLLEYNTAGAAAGGKPAEYLVQFALEGLLSDTPPDASQHDPRPEYLRALIEQADLSQRKTAALLGLSDRMMRHYLADEAHTSHRSAPYRVQYALEGLARYK